MNLQDFAAQEKLDRLVSTPPLPTNTAKPKQEHVKAGITWKTKDEGTITSPPSANRDATWDDLLREWGYDPDDYEIVEPVSLATWEGYIKNKAGEIETTTLWSKKAGIRKRRLGARKDADLEALVEQIKQFDFTERMGGGIPISNEFVGDLGFVINFSDWQLGNCEDGGTKHTVTKIQTSFQHILDRIHELRAIGRRIDTLYIFGLGDVVENCDGFYPMQTFGTDLDMREQRTLARRLIIQSLELFAPQFTNTVVAAVPGNHGENRKDGKAFTTFGDNSDVEVFEQVMDALALANNPIFENVSFVLPKNQLHLSLNIHGKIVGLAHGHQANAGTTPQKKIVDWWKNMAWHDGPMHDVDILFTGHYHHLSIVEYGDKVHFQAPNMNGTQQWWVEGGGSPSNCGTLTLTIGADGWQDLAVL